MLGCQGMIPISLFEDTSTISVPNGFAREYIESRLVELLEGALSKHHSPTSSRTSPGLEVVVGIEDATDNTERREP